MILNCETGNHLAVESPQITGGDRLNRRDGGYMILRAGE